MKKTSLINFFVKVDVRPDGCWLWTAHVNASGYGTFGVDGHSQLAHRVSYFLHVGAIPDGKQLDHLCHTADLSCVGGTTCPHRRCVNPAHLEPVALTENIFRSPNTRASINASRTHCPQGHAYDEANTYLMANPGNRMWRACRACRAAHKASKRLKVAA